MLFIALCIYWNLAHTTFFYRTHHWQWHVAPIPKDNITNNWIRFDQKRETYKLDNECHEKVKNEKALKKDIFRAYGIFAEECIIDITKDQYETSTKWNNSFESFFNFLTKSSFLLCLITGLTIGIGLFSGFIDTILAWLKTGSWAEKN